MKEEERLE